MRSTRWRELAALALVLGMAGCAPAEVATPIPTLVLEPGAPSEGGIVKASAQVVPSQDARLSFSISGAIAELTVEEGETVIPGQTLATLSAPNLEFAVLQAEAEVRAAEYQYEYWRLPRIVNRRLVERGELAARELDLARRSLEAAQAELTRTHLNAPFSATVVSIRVRPGEHVQPGQVVIVLADLEGMEIETTDLSERDVAAIQAGQPASVYIEALDEDFPGTVTAVSPVSDSIGGDVVFEVSIRFQEPPPGLLWGMSAEVRIETEQ